MSKITPIVPILLAALIVAAAFGFVRYYDAYEAPGDHWAPASPIVHEHARFTTDMGTAGDFHVTVEKISAKLPLFFVEYQTPGKVLEMTVHSDDGIVRLDQNFADEGQYRVTVQHSIHPMHKEVIDFTVQTPLVKYTNDVLLFVFLVAAGFLSGKRLRALAVVCLVVCAGGMAAPEQALAHGNASASDAVSFPNQVGDVSLHWLHGKSPTGQANREPMDWRMTIAQHGQAVEHAPFALDVVHSETHLPVLHVEGVANHGVIELKYSPPDGTAYEFQVRTQVGGKVYHLGLKAEAEAIPPTAWRKWQSFLLMMIPLLLGMVWGWKRGAAV